MAVMPYKSLLWQAAAHPTQHGWILAAVHQPSTGAALPAPHNREQPAHCRQGVPWSGDFGPNRLSGAVSLRRIWIQGFEATLHIPDMASCGKCCEIETEEGDSHAAEDVFCGYLQVKEPQLWLCVLFIVTAACSTCVPHVIGRGASGQKMAIPRFVVSRVRPKTLSGVKYLRIAFQPLLTVSIVVTAVVYCFRGGRFPVPVIYVSPYTRSEQTKLRCFG